MGVTSGRNNRGGARFGSVGVSPGENMVVWICADDG